VALLGQLMNIVSSNNEQQLDRPSIGKLLSLIRGIGPSDELEAMTATMIIAVQHAALDTMRRAMHPDQTPGGRQSYTALSLKAMRTYAQLVETLNRGRGKGVTQRVIVERVNVEAGGQAVVGAVSDRGGGR
jgi:hypothetical protein